MKLRTLRDFLKKPFQRRLSSGAAHIELAVLFAFLLLGASGALQSNAVQSVLAQTELLEQQALSSIASSAQLTSSFQLQANGNLALPATHGSDLLQILQDYGLNLGLPIDNHCIATVEVALNAGVAQVQLPATHAFGASYPGACGGTFSAFCTTRIEELASSTGAASRSQEFYSCIWSLIDGEEAVQVIALPGLPQPAFS